MKKITKFLIITAFLFGVFQGNFSNESQKNTNEYVIEYGAYADDLPPQHLIKG